MMFFPIHLYGLVAPLAGAWIEMSQNSHIMHYTPVAPLAGAWIEILGSARRLPFVRRRSPRGSVD